MTGIKPSSHGIVVQHEESGVRYAVSDKNYNEKVHRKVRDLRPGETILGYRPKAGSEASEAALSPQSGTGTADQPAKSESSRSEALADGSAKTEGAATAASQEKEGK